MASNIFKFSVNVHLPPGQSCFYAGDNVAGVLQLNAKRTVTLGSLTVTLASEVVKTGASSSRPEIIKRGNPIPLQLPNGNTIAKGQAEVPFQVMSDENAPSSLVRKHQGEVHNVIIVSFTEASKPKKVWAEPLRFELKSCYNGSWPPPALTHTRTEEFKGGASFLEKAKYLGHCELSMVMPAIVSLQSEAAVSFTLKIANTGALEPHEMKFLVGFVTSMNRDREVSDIISHAAWVPSVNYDSASGFYRGELRFPINGSNVGEYKKLPTKVPASRIKREAALPSVKGKVFGLSNTLQLHAFYCGKLKASFVQEVNVVEHARPRQGIPPPAAAMPHQHPPAAMAQQPPMQHMQASAPAAGPYGAAPGQAAGPYGGHPQQGLPAYGQVPQGKDEKQPGGPLQGQYPPPQGQYPPPQGQYPPQGHQVPQGQYPMSQQGFYPPQGQYPHPQGQYPPPQGQYPPAGGNPPPY